MTTEQFKAIAERCKGDDMTRPSMTSVFRYGGHAFATDGRIAIMYDSNDAAIPAAEGTQSHLGEQIKDLFPSEIPKEYCEYTLDAAKLTAAAQAAIADLDREMEQLRTRGCDPDDPDDPGPDSVSQVQRRLSEVLMPDEQRTVIAGYFAAIVADAVREHGPVHAFASCKSPNMAMYFMGPDWRIAVMPICTRHSDGAWAWDNDSSVADAATGELVRHYGETRPTIQELTDKRKDEQ